MAVHGNMTIPQALCMCDCVHIAQSPFLRLLAAVMKARDGKDVCV